MKQTSEKLGFCVVINNMRASVLKFNRFITEPKPRAEVVDQVLLDEISFHDRVHEEWRWYGIKPELRRLYELWEEIAEEDRVRKERFG